jgi:arylsulfatase A-like enzyme
MASSWDAPLELRNALVEADEPPPPQHAHAPCEMLDKDYDPDELHGYGCAYAGQVMVLDTCIGAMLDLLGERELLDNTLVVLIGLRGFPLGEHGRLGDVDAALYGELVHVPWLLRMPGGVGAMCRSQALVQPPDLYATLSDWSQLDMPCDSSLARSVLPLVRGEPAVSRDQIAIVDGDQQQALRTPAWYLRQVGNHTTGDEHEGRELFSKPDDRWEQNEIASRCRDVVDQLGDALVRFQQSAAASPTADPPPLEEVLRVGLG